MQLKIDNFPAGPDDLRAKVLRVIQGQLDLLEAMLVDPYPGCSIDRDTIDSVNSAVSTIETALAGATFRVDPQGRQRLVMKLAALDAANDEGFRSFTKSLGLE